VGEERESANTKILRCAQNDGVLLLAVFAGGFVAGFFAVVSKMN